MQISKFKNGSRAVKALNNPKGIEMQIGALSQVFKKITPIASEIPNSGRLGQAKYWTP